MCIRDRIKTEKYTENKSVEKVTLPPVGTVHVKAPVSYTHLDVYKRQM